MGSARLRLAAFTARKASLALVMSALPWDDLSTLIVEREHFGLGEFEELVEAQQFLEGVVLGVLADDLNWSEEYVLHCYLYYRWESLW